MELAPGENEALEQVLAEMERRGLDPPWPEELFTDVGLAAARAAELVALLRRQNRLLRVADGYLVHHRVIARLKETLWRRREDDPVLDVAAFKDLTGTSRRTAIPLLEFLDSERVTVRRGNTRLIQEPPAPR